MRSDDASNGLPASEGTTESFNACPYETNAPNTHSIAYPLPQPRVARQQLVPGMPGWGHSYHVITWLGSSTWAVAAEAWCGGCNRWGTWLQVLNAEFPFFARVRYGDFHS